MGLAALAAFALAQHCAVPGFTDVRVAGANLYVGGNQDAAQLKKLHGFGVRFVIDLRPEKDGEAKDAARAKLKYRKLPVHGADDLTLANAQALDAAILEAKGAPVLVHCTSGNRAAALLALRDALVLRQPKDQSLSFMKRSGLTTLADAVAAKIPEEDPSARARPR